MATGQAQPAPYGPPQAIGLYSHCLTALSMNPRLPLSSRRPDGRLVAALLLALAWLSAANPTAALAHPDHHQPTQQGEHEHHHHD